MDANVKALKTQSTDTEKNVLRQKKLEKLKATLNKC